MNTLFIGLIVSTFFISICAPRENEPSQVHSVWKEENRQSDKLEQISTLQDVQKNDSNRDV